ncbi:MAG: HlyD family efflux transporter periplasmic adaptor subunit [Actinomycetes bacterium]
MARDDEPIKRKSDIMGEIFDIVEGDSGQSETAETPRFRAQALRQLDVPKSLDNLLQLTPPRMWIAIVGTAIVIIAALIYAGSTVRVQSIAATGRAVAAPGVGTAPSPADGVITEVLVAQGASVKSGDPIARGLADSGSPMTVLAPVSGQVWQQIAGAGTPVIKDEAVTQILPTNSGSQVLLQVPEADSAGMEVGQKVNLTAAGKTGTGTLTTVDSAPTPGLAAAEELAIEPPSQTQVIMVTVTADPPLRPGDAVSAQIVLSERTLLSRLLGL